MNLHQSCTTSPAAPSGATLVEVHVIVAPLVSAIYGMLGVARG